MTWLIICLIVAGAVSQFFGINEVAGRRRQTYRLFRSLLVHAGVASVGVTAGDLSDSFDSAQSLHAEIEKLKGQVNALEVRVAEVEGKVGDIVETLPEQIKTRSQAPAWGIALLLAGLVLTTTAGILALGQH